MKVSSLRSESGSSGPVAKDCHRFLVAGPFWLAACRCGCARDRDYAFKRGTTLSPPSRRMRVTARATTPANSSP